MVSRGVEQSIKRRVEHVERRSVHYVHHHEGEQVGKVVGGGERTSNHTRKHSKANVLSWKGEGAIGRRDGVAMVQCTQGKRWKRHQVS